MKRLSASLLIILCWTTIASAIVQIKSDIIIYSYTEKSTDYTCDFTGSTADVINTLEWEKSVEKKTGYLVMQRGAPPSSMVYCWHIYTWKAPDPNGKMQKYAQMGSYVIYSLNTAHVGDKVTWIFGLSNSNEHFTLKGDEKSVMIKAADEYHDIAKSLTGTHSWYYQAGTIQHAGLSTISLKYHSRFTNDYYSDPGLPNGMEAGSEIVMEYLKSRGYIPVPG